MPEVSSMSILTFENNAFIVRVNKVGGELCGFYSKKTETEYIWSGDPGVWASTAPVLFPIIGALKNGYYLYDGIKYSIPKHGFIRHSNNLHLENITDTSCSLTLSSNEKTREMYPFEFKFSISFTLLNDSLVISHSVANLSNNQAMFFSLGAHPAFKCPFSDQHSYEDYYIDFEEKESVSRWSVLKDGTIGGVKVPFLEREDRIKLNHDLFQEDALIFKDLKSRKATLKNRLDSNEIEVTFNDFEYLGIWAKTDGDFVCIEPWLGISDNSDTNNELKDKEGIIELEPNGNYQASYSIKIKEDTL